MYKNQARSSNPKIPPKHFEWNYWEPEHGYHFPEEVIFFTDTHIPTAPLFSCRQKVAWIIEPRVHYDIAYLWLPHNLREFDYVITYDRELAQLDDKKILFIPHGGTLLGEDEIGIPEEKTGFCSMMVSRSHSYAGHVFRHQVHHEFIDLVHGYGLGSSTNPVYLENKGDALKPYKFHVVVENSIQDDYFAEVLTDPMLCGAVPIYWGTDKIREYFPKLSLTFRTMVELRQILERVKKVDYSEFEEERISNFEIARNKYFQRENIFWEQYPFLFNPDSGKESGRSKFFPLTLRSSNEKKLAKLQQKIEKLTTKSDRLRAENKRLHFERNWAQKLLRQAREERDAAMRVAGLEVFPDKEVSWEKCVGQLEREKLKHKF